MLKGGFTRPKISEGALEVILGTLFVLALILFAIFASDSVYIPEGKSVAVVSCGTLAAILLFCLFYIWRNPYRESSGGGLSYETTQKIMYIVLSSFLLLFALILTDTIKISSNSSKSAALLGTGLPIVITLGYVLYALWPVKTGLE